MAKVVLSGYATVDFIARAIGPITPAGTNEIEVAHSGWPRGGGAPLYAGDVLARAGHDVSLICSLGDDASGDVYLEQVRHRKLQTETIEIIPSARTPACVLIHQASGDYCCFLDSGSPWDGPLTEKQFKAVERADWLVITAGPAKLTALMLEHARADQKVAWLVKADARSFPPNLAGKLKAMADFVFCNRHERDFLFASEHSVLCSAQTLFETDGARGVRVVRGAHSSFHQAKGVNTGDATGAGDTFAGGALSILIEESEALVTAARAGMAAATGLLEERASSGVIE